MTRAPSYQTTVDCVRECGNDCVDATFYEAPDLWFFSQCECSPHAYSVAEQAQLEARGERKIEAAYDRAHA